ncbi:hypothetical protein A9W93_14085 [Mycobacterium colombiense]|nr:hypothetical protein A9W93_14085 [Mycobacterium colombiense]
MLTYVLGGEDSDGEQTEDCSGGQPQRPIFSSLESKRVVVYVVDEFKAGRQIIAMSMTAAVDAIQDISDVRSSIWQV